MRELDNPQQGNIPIHLARYYGQAVTRTLEKQKFIIHIETTEPTENGITQSYTLKLTVTLYLTKAGLTVTLWREVKTSAASLDKEGKRVREFKLINS